MDKQQVGHPSWRRRAMHCRGEGGRQEGGVLSRDEMPTVHVYGDPAEKDAVALLASNAWVPCIHCWETESKRSRQPPSRRGGSTQRGAEAADRDRASVPESPPHAAAGRSHVSMETISDRLVQEGLERLAVRRTCVVVVHSLSTICNADNIIVMRVSSPHVIVHPPIVCTFYQRCKNRASTGAV